MAGELFTGCGIFFGVLECSQPSALPLQRVNRISPLHHGATSSIWSTVTNHFGFAAEALPALARLSLCYSTDVQATLDNGGLAVQPRSEFSASKPSTSVPD